MSSPTSQPKKTLRELREARGWTQADVAGRVRVHPNMVSRWERGLDPPRVQNRNRLAEVFGVRIDAIAFRQDGRP